MLVAVLSMFPPPQAVRRGSARVANGFRPAECGSCVSGGLQWREDTKQHAGHLLSGIYNLGISVVLLEAVVASIRSEKTSSTDIHRPRVLEKNKLPEETELKREGIMRKRAMRHPQQQTDVSGVGMRLTNRRQHGTVCTLRLGILKIRVVVDDRHPRPPPMFFWLGPR